MVGGAVLTRPPKPGRPPASADGARREPRQIRFTDAEWSWVRTQAANHGQHAAEWIRARLLLGMTQLDAPRAPK